MDFDLLVLGSGPGGYIGAIRAAQLGMKAGLVEARELGGTCLNRGCIPTKVLVETMHALSLAQRSEEYGVITSEVRLDFDRMMKRKDQVVQRLRKGVESLLKKNKVEVIRGRGRLADANTIEVQQDAKTLKATAKNLIVATGSETLRLKAFPCDGKTVITSDNALELSKAPESVLIVGGGYIGVEWTGIFRSAGVEVTVVEMMDQLLPRSDPDLAAELLKTLKKRGVTVHLETRVDSVKVKKGGAECNLTNGKQVQAEKVLVSVGRSMNSADIGLEAAGVKTENGAIVIDEHCCTNVPNIYAIGNVTGKMMLAHVASRQGIVAAEHIAGRNSRMQYRVIPSCIFSYPEIGSVGRTAAECKEEGIEVKEARFPFMALGKAQVLGETHGWAKILADAKTGEVLGVHLIGPRATDLIAEAALAMTLEATVEEIAHTIHAHPTLPEVILEAAEAWLGQGIHM